MTLQHPTSTRRSYHLLYGHIEQQVADFENIAEASNMMVGWLAYAGFLRPRAAGKVRVPLFTPRTRPPK
jgi:hypothetical protein